MDADGYRRGIGCYARRCEPVARPRRGWRPHCTSHAQASRPSDTIEQIEQLLALLLKGAEAHGFLGDVWTRQRIVDVIARHFGVRLSLPTISRLMRRIGWTHQRPELHAVQRDDAAVEQLKSTRWPVLKKSPSPRAHDSLYR